MKNKRLRMKKLIILAILLLGAVVVCVCIGVRKKSGDKEICFSAGKNENFTRELAGNRENTLNIEKITLRLGQVAEDAQVSGSLTLTLENSKVDVEVKGHIYFYESENGYVGALDGEGSIGSQVRHVTVDLSYVSSEVNFTAVTIGYIGDEEITCFGEYTDAIGRLQEVKRNER